MVYTRTATFIESVMEIGAVLGNANDLELNALKHYGKNLGSVFQLVNDLNNILGIEEGYGRVASSEAQKGIKSLPISHFVQQVSSDEKGVFLNRLLSGELHYQDLVESLETKSSLSFTVNIIENCLSEARFSLKQTRRNSGTVILEEIIQHFHNYVQFYIHPLIRQQAEIAKAS
jgi:geranylgeranyl pyrophosphate synthase